MKKIMNFLKLIRLKHWLKNLLVFFPLIFNLQLFNFNSFIKVALGFLSFCFISSSIYIINDIRDVEKDRKHEVKKKRPIAAGIISIKEALIISLLLTIISVLLNLLFINNINGQYLWNDLTNKLPLCGIFIFLISVIGAISKRKELISKISSIWIIFAFILFTFLNWSTHESPLFNLYFSWAVIPMFVYGVDFIVEKLKLNSKFVYLFLYIIICFINISTLLDIYKFLI